jgi:hypothetical protein
MQTSTKLELKDIPGMPGLVAYQITAPTAAEVQVTITRIMNRISNSGGIAEFRNPYRQGSEWLSRGYVKENTSDQAES